MIRSKELSLANPENFKFFRVGVATQVCTFSVPKLGRVVVVVVLSLDSRVKKNPIFVKTIQLNEGYCILHNTL